MTARFAKKPGERSAPPTRTRQERIAMSQPCAPLVNLPVHEAARFVLKVAREMVAQSGACARRRDAGSSFRRHDPYSSPPSDDVDDMRP